MKYKRIAAALAALLLALSAGFALPGRALAATFCSEVRVLLSIGKTTALAFTPVGAFSLQEAPELELTGEELTVYAVGGRVSLTIGGTTLSAPSFTLVNGNAGTNEKTAYIRLKNSEHGNCTYLGNLTFDVRAGALRAINTLPVEQYLYGVVPNEMSNSFPLEALKAQSVCARSYAMAKCSRYAGRSYDLGDTSNDQVYAGFASKNARAIAAVDATAGQVLTFEGEIIEAFYSSSNGGQTERAANAWGEDYPYYINRDDPYDLMNPSSLEYLAFIPAQFSDAAVALMDRDVYAALLRGAYELAGEQVKLLSTVCVRPYAAEYDAPSRSFTLADVTLNVQKADGREGQLTVTLTLKDFLYGQAENTLGAFGARTYTLRLRGAERAAQTLDGQALWGWNLTMRRWGHGVGLSQRGAQQRARLGQSAGDILGFYYAGTTLSTIGTWQSAPRITSSSYHVAEWGISGIAPGTKAQALLGKLACEDALSFVTAKGEQTLEGEVVTGSFVRVAYDQGQSFFDLPLILYGDVDGEAGITQGDAAALGSHLSRVQPLSGARLLAADVNHDGAVDEQDLLTLLRTLQGDAVIKQKG